MKIGLVVNGFVENSKFNTLYSLLFDSAKKNNIELIKIKTTDFLINFEDDIINYLKEHKIEKIIFWDKDVLFAKYLENNGFRLYNNSQSIEICDDKNYTNIILANNNIPIPKTILMPFYYSEYKNLDFINNLKINYPVILKEAKGSFGMQVYLVNNEEELKEKLFLLSPKRMQIQEYIFESSGKDIRVMVVFGKVVAAIEREAKDDFRANLTLGATAKTYVCSKFEEELAIKISKILNLDFCGIDFLKSSRGILVCEVNSNAHFKNLFDVTNINVADYIFEGIKNN